MTKILTVITVLLLTTFNSLKADELTGINWYLTLEEGKRSDLKYGYIGGSKQLGKWNLNGSSTWNVDSVDERTLFHLSSMNYGFSYQINDHVSFYTNMDVNPHFIKTETWSGITFTW